MATLQQDLLDVIGHNLATEETGYCVTSGKGPGYWDWEEEVAIPALRRLGYRVISQYNGEADSFGPLSRVIKVESPLGNIIELVYG